MRLHDVLTRFQAQAAQQICNLPRPPSCMKPRHNADPPVVGQQRDFQSVTPPRLLSTPIHKASRIW
jgi:hypothetical protein